MKRVERTLPHDLEAERSVLGASLLHQEAYDAAVQVLAPGDCFRDAHRRLFEAMGRLVERGSAIDLVTLRAELTRTGELAEVGGAVYIASLVDGVPRSSNVAHYAGIVREKAALREAIFAANRVLEAAYAHEDPAGAFDGVEAAIAKLHGSGRSGEDLRHVQEGLPEVLAQIEQAQAHQQPLAGLQTGLAELDEATLGLHPGQLTIVAARPSCGKTTLVMQIAAHAARTVTVAAYSLEQTREELLRRLLSAESRVDSQRLVSGAMTGAELPRVGHAAQLIRGRALWVDDTPDRSVPQIRASARRLRARHGLGLVVVDYLQLLAEADPRKNDMRTMALARMTRGLRAMAKELRVPVVVVSQLTRANEQQSRRPRLSDLRESGSIEQDADGVWFIHDPSDGEEDPMGEQTGVVRIIVAKQRNGPKLDTSAVYLRHCYRFENLAHGAAA